MPQLQPFAPVTLVLVGDDRLVEAAVQASCPPPNTIRTFTMEGIVNAQNSLSTHGQTIVEAARDAAAMLVAWRLDLAPVINTLCYHVRRGPFVPVIALCGGNPEDQVAAIAAGADEAVSFPLYLPLIQARSIAYRRLVKAVEVAAEEKRSDGRAPEPPARADVLQIGELRVDRVAHRFYVHSQEVELTPREFSLLSFLMEHVGELLTRDEILDKVWGINFDTGTNMVDVYMYFLRRKLESHGVRSAIQTVRGHGYRLVPREAVSS